MFYENENEKDVIGNDSEIQITEDGVVSWGDVLDDTSDDLVSVVNDDSSDDAVIPEASEDEIHVDTSEEPDEEELRRILSDGDNSEDASDQDFDLSDEEKSEQDFEFDSSMLDNEKFTSQDVPAQEVSERKAPQKSSSGIMPVLLALLVALIVVGGVYYYINFVSANKETSNGDLVPNNQINDLTQEELEQRNQEQQQQQQDIPVVNEDTQDLVQADDAQANEKKEVVDIRLGGRANPFLPSSKYLSVEVPETYIDFENPSIPKPPETFGSENSPAVKMLSISVSGIMYDNVKPSAIITYEGNDYFVQRGDKLNEYRVIDIGKNYVLISLGRNTYKANVGEEFKITDNFYGSAKYLPTGRQYQIVGNGKDSSESVEIKVD